MRRETWLLILRCYLLPILVGVVVVLETPWGCSKQNKMLQHDKLGSSQETRQIFRLRRRMREWLADWCFSAPLIFNMLSDPAFVKKKLASRLFVLYALHTLETALVYWIQYLYDSKRLTSTRGRYLLSYSTSMYMISVTAVTTANIIRALGWEHGLEQLHYGDNRLISIFKVHKTLGLVLFT